MMSSLNIETYKFTKLNHSLNLNWLVQPNFHVKIIICLLSLRMHIELLIGKVNTSKNEVLQGFRKTEN